MDQVEGVVQKPAGGPAPPVWIFAFLVLPPAVLSNGFVGTALGSLLRSEKMPLADIASYISVLQLPSMLYFLWSPLVDFWIRRRTWVAVSAAGAGLLVWTTLQWNTLGGAWQESLLVVALMLSLLVSAALGGLMAEVVPAKLKTRASGFFQVGNLGLAALAGGGVLYLSEHLARRQFAAVCALVIAVPGLLALTIAEPEVVRGDGLGHTLGRIGREFKHTFLKWEAVPVLLCLCAPFGSGAAIGLYSGLAPDYAVSVDQVALINGLGGGLLMGLGAALISLLKLPDDIRPVYAGLGLVNALTLGILLVGHPRPVTYLASVVLYMVSVGACYGTFTALVLKLIGASGKSGGCRYAIALSIGNAPIWYMTVVDGLGARWFGVKGMPAADMVVSGGLAAVALGWFWWERKRGIVPELGLAVEEA
jgi:MFS transporter, PAT family, beta-lactamase induction signal transducer AmpG